MSSRSDSYWSTSADGERRCESCGLAWYEITALYYDAETETTYCDVCLARQRAGEYQWEQAQK